MKETWAIMALAVLILVACLARGPQRRRYDCATMAPFDPTRSIRVVLFQPFCEAATALEVTADW